MTLDDISDELHDEHFDLRYRVACGDPLATAADRLRELNALIVPLMPKPEGVPPDVKAAIAEARRLLGSDSSSR